MQQRTAIAADHRLEQTATLDRFPAAAKPPKEEAPDAMPQARDVTRLPNWLMPVIIAAFLGLLGLVWQANTTKVAEIDQARKEAVSDVKREYDGKMADQMTEIRILRTYVIQLTIEMNKRGISVPALPPTK